MKKKTNLLEIININRSKTHHYVYSTRYFVAHCSIVIHNCIHIYYYIVLCIKHHSISIPISFIVGPKIHGSGVKKKIRGVEQWKKKWKPVARSIPSNTYYYNPCILITRIRNFNVPHFPIQFATFFYLFFSRWRSHSSVSRASYLLIRLTFIRCSLLILLVIVKIDIHWIEGSLFRWCFSGHRMDDKLIPLVSGISRIVSWSVRAIAGEYF